MQLSFFSIHPPSRGSGGSGSNGGGISSRTERPSARLFDYSWFLNYEFFSVLLVLFNNKMNGKTRGVGWSWNVLFYFSKILNVIIFLKNQTFIIKFFLFRLLHELFSLILFECKKNWESWIPCHHCCWLPEVRVSEKKICNLKCNLFF